MDSNKLNNITYIKNDKGDIIAEIVGEINIDYLTRSIYNIAQNLSKLKTSI